MAAMIKRAQKNELLDEAVTANEEYLNLGWVIAFEKKKNDAEHKHSVLKDKMEKLKLDHESRMAMMVK